MGKNVNLGDEDLGEELYNLLAQVLNSTTNREFFDSIRGEYGVLWYLLKSDKTVNAGDLREQLHVVPGRMTDILTALEKKGFITRNKDENDRRVVNVELTESGEEEALRRRQAIHEKYSGLFNIMTYEETKELIRLLNILLTY